MVKQTAVYFWNARREVAKYIVVGGSGVVLDIGTLKLFHDVWGWHVTASVAINQVLLLAYNFTLNKYWSFRNTEVPHKQVVRYLTLAGGNYVVSVAAIHIFAEVYQFNAILVRLITIAVATTWNFVLYKQWVYKQTESSATEKG